MVKTMLILIPDSQFPTHAGSSSVRQRVIIRRSDHECTQMYLSIHVFLCFFCFCFLFFWLGIVQTCIIGTMSSSSTATALPMRVREKIPSLLRYIASLTPLASMVKVDICRQNSADFSIQKNMVESGKIRQNENVASQWNQSVLHFPKFGRSRQKAA